MGLRSFNFAASLRIWLFSAMSSTAVFRRLFSDSRRFSLPDLVDPEAAVLTAPAVEGLLGHSYSACCLGDNTTLGYTHPSLPSAY